MNNSFSSGSLFFLQGLRLIFTRPFRRYIIFPVLLNTFLTLCSVLYAYYLFNKFIHFLEANPNVSHWTNSHANHLIHFVSYGILISIAALSFGFFNSFINAYFYSALSQAILQQNKQQKFNFTLPYKITMSKLFHILLRELYKIGCISGYYLVCLILSLLPLTTPFAPVFWILAFVWITAMQYIDYTADNQHIPLSKLLPALQKIPRTSLGFEGIAALFMVIPGAYLIIPVAAVAGGALLCNNLMQSNPTLSLHHEHNG